jgi:hypothetical protein
MKIEKFPGFQKEMARCQNGHAHTAEPVWASEQQSGMYSRKQLPTFHCGECGARRSASARRDNWRPFKLSEVLDGETIFACKRCLPRLGVFLEDFWAKLLKGSRPIG